MYGTPMMNTLVLIIAIYTVKEKMLLVSFTVRFLYWIIAGAIPISLIMLKKVMTMVAIATTPKSSGVNSLAKIAVTINEMKILEYLPIPV